MELPINQGTTSSMLRKAFRILRRNYGCPGEDGISIRHIRRNFDDYASRLEYEIATGIIVFTQPREIIINTGNITEKSRNINVYNVHDRWIQCYLRLLIEPKLNCILEDTVYSYRIGRTRYQGLANLVRDRPNYVLLLDIKEFYENVCQQRLFDLLISIGIIESVAFLIMEAVKHAGSGLPKGNCLSPALANLYLISLDRGFGSNYMRYSDDLLFAVCSQKDALHIITLVSDLLHDLNLELIREKSRLFCAPMQSHIIEEYPWFQSLKSLSYEEFISGNL